MIRNYTGKQKIFSTRENARSVILNVNDYHEFLPWCSDSRILNGNEKNFSAELAVSFSTIQNTYLSKVYWDNKEKRDQIHIEVNNSGPFRSLKALWTIEDMSNYSNNTELKELSIQFDIQYEAKSKFWDLLINKSFIYVYNKIFKAFYDRLLS